MRLIDADELIHTTEFVVMIASTLTTDKVKKGILKELQKFLKERVDDAPTIDNCSNFNTNSVRQYRYCPHCGAKMDEGEIIWKRYQRYLKEFLMKTE